MYFKYMRNGDKNVFTNTENLVKDFDGISSRESLQIYQYFNLGSLFIQSKGILYISDMFSNFLYVQEN